MRALAGEGADVDPAKAPEFGQAVRAGVEQMANLVEKVNFPSFVSGLIQGVFHSIVDSSIQQMEAYAKLAGPALSAAGGKFLARGNPAKTMEQGLMQRTVLIEFPSVEKAIAAYNSPGYAEALAALGKHAAERDIRIVEGVE